MCKSTSSENKNINLQVVLCNTKLLLVMVIGIISFNINNVLGAPIVSNGGGGGNWSVGLTWVGGIAPSAGDDVTITAGDLVSVDVTGTTCHSVTVFGDGNIGADATLIINLGVTFNVTGNIDLTSVNGGGSPSISTTGNSATSILNANSDINFNADDGSETPSLAIPNKSALNISGNFNLYSSNSLAGITFGLTSVVTYSGAGTQTIIAVNYGTLKSSGTGGRILAPSPTILIRNNTTNCFTPGTNSYTVTNSTINFGGGGSQTIPAFNYYNLTTSAARTSTFSITFENSATPVGIAGAFVNGATFSSGGYITTGSTINFNGTGNQTIPMPATALYNHLKINCTGPTGATLAAAVSATNVTGNITVETGILDNGGFAIVGNAGKSFTVNNGASFVLNGTSGMPTGGGFTPPSLGATSTVDYSGNGAQTIESFNYGNLTSSDGGGRTLASSGTIGVLGVFNPGANAYTITGSTISFNGSGAQTIPVFSYNNLTVSNARTANSITLVNGGTIGIAGTFNPTATFTSGTYVITNNTIDFNGSGGQPIPAFNYNNLTSSSTGTRTLASSGTIGVAGVLTPGTNVYTVTGSTINFNGTSNQNIPMPAATALYNHMQVNCTGGTGATLAAAVNTTNVTGNITVQTGTLNNGGFAMVGNGGNTFQVDNGATFRLTGSSAMPSGFTTTTLGTSSTVDYNGSGAQTMAAINYGNLTSSSTGARTLPSAGTVGIAGVFAVGTNVYTTTGSTVNFNAAGAQTIPVLPSPADYINITVSGSGTKFLAGNMNLIGTLTLSAGTFDVNGHIFTMISNASGTASIAAITGGASFAGNITMQRYAPASLSTNDWRLLSSAVSGAKISDWTDNFATSGFTGATCNPSNCGTTGCGATCNDPSIYTYDETALGNLDQGYTAPGSTNDALDGKGLLVYLGPTPVTFDVTGPPNTGDQTTIPVSYTDGGTGDHASDDGWNLVPNPYPCTINWDAATDGTHWTKTNIGGSIYVYNSIAGTYASYVAGSSGVGVNGGSNLIASQQSFWIQASAAPTFAIRELCKAPTYTTTLLKTSSPNTSYYPMAFTDYPIPLNTNSLFNSIKLTATGKGRDDETFIRFKPGATNDFDYQDDAWKFFNPDTTIHNFSSVIAGNKDLSINSLPELDSDISSITVPLRLTVPACGCTSTYSIRRDSMLMLPISSCIILEDKKTGGMIDLRTNVSYSFTISDTTKAPRFMLHIYAPFAKKAIHATCSGSSDGKAIAKGKGTAPWNYVWKNSVGTIVKATTGSTTADTLFNCSPGTYSVSVSGGVCGTMADTVIVKAPEMLANTSSQTDASCYGIHDGSATIITTGGTPGYSYLWSNGQTTSMASNLSFGNYSVAITDSHGCTSIASVSIAQPVLLSPALSTTNVSCFGRKDGSANASVSGGHPPYSFLWNNGKSTSAVSDLPSGNYSVTITDTKGCTSLATAAITQPALLAAGYTASSYSVDIALGSAVTFTNTSSGASAYEWNFGDGSGISVSVNPTHSYSLTGTYTVTLISSNVPCVDTAYSTIVVINSNPTGLNGNQSAISINVAYDNGQVFLVFSLSQATKVNIIVYNMIGEEIFSQNNLLVKNERVKLDFPSTSVGVYVAVSEMKDAIISKKIFIPIH